MRLFFGLPTPEGTATEIADWRDRSLRCAGRAVAPANFHITLAFAGEVDTRQADALCNAAEDSLQQLRPAADTLTLDELGYWPKPGILWLGPQHWPQTLTVIAEKLRHAVVTAGGKRDRNPFHPHVTLFRRCESPPQAAVSSPAIPFDYTALALFESRRGKNGMHYHNIGEWRLWDSSAGNFR